MSDRIPRSQRLLSDHEEPIAAPITGIADCVLPILLHDAVTEIVEASGESALVTLRENVELALAFASSKCTDSPALYGLVLDEIAAIHLYTQDTALFQVLNAILRSQEQGQIRPFLKYLKLLLNALYKLPAVKRNVYRAVRRNIQTLGWVQGDIITWWGFSSTTRTLSILNDPEFFGVEGNRTLMMVSVRSGVNISEFSAYPHEDETLMLPGTKLRFADLLPLSPGDEAHMVVLHEQPDDGHPCLDFTRDMVYFDDEQQRLEHGIMQNMQDLAAHDFEGVRLAACNQLLTNQKVITQLVERIESQCGHLPEERLEACRGILTGWQSVTRETVTITIKMSKATQEKKRAVAALKTLHVHLREKFPGMEPIDERTIEPDILRSMTVRRDNAIRCLQKVMGCTTDTDQLEALIAMYDDLLVQIVAEISALEANRERLQREEAKLLTESRDLEAAKKEKAEEIAENSRQIWFWTFVCGAVLAASVVVVATSFPAVMAHAADTWNRLKDCASLGRETSLSMISSAEAQIELDAASRIVLSAERNAQLSQAVADRAMEAVGSRSFLHTIWDPEKTKSLAQSAWKASQEARELAAKFAESKSAEVAASHKLASCAAEVSSNQGALAAAGSAASSSAYSLAGVISSKCGAATAVLALRRRMKNQLQRMEQELKMMNQQKDELSKKKQDSDDMMKDLSLQISGITALRDQHRALHDELSQCKLGAWQLESSVEFLNTFLDTEGLSVWDLLKDPEKGEELDNLHQRLLEVEQKIGKLNELAHGSCKHVSPSFVQGPPDRNRS